MPRAALLKFQIAFPYLDQLFVSGNALSYVVPVAIMVAQSILGSPSEAVASRRLMNIGEAAATDMALDTS